MIKAAGTNLEKGCHMILIGLSRGNCEKLLAEEPIQFNLESMGLPPMDILIMGGETEEAMYKELKGYGLLDNAKINEDVTLKDPHLKRNQDA